MQYLLYVRGVIQICNRKHGFFSWLFSKLWLWEICVILRKLCVSCDYEVRIRRVRRCVKVHINRWNIFEKRAKENGNVKKKICDWYLHSYLASGISRSTLASSSMSRTADSLPRNARRSADSLTGSINDNVVHVDEFTPTRWRYLQANWSA